MIKLREVGFHRCYLSEITIAELLYGIEKGSVEKKITNLKKVKDLRDSFSNRVIPISECLEEYAYQKAQLRKMGRIVADLDIFIGTTALINGLTLATRNTKDFINITGLNLENWIDNI